MNLLKRLYASGGKEIIFNTLEIIVGGNSQWLVENFEDITATTESGDVITFKATAMAVALPVRNNDGTQDLNFALSNIEGEVSTVIRNALNNLHDAKLVLRQFVSTDLASPAAPPISMQIKEGQWTATQAQITAGFLNILDTAWPRLRYILSLFPGLRYIT